MHPQGIKFGLSQGLLEFRADDVVLSRRLLENVSEMARRKRVTFIWDEVRSSALRRTPFSLDGVPRQECVPFFTGLERVIYITMMPIADEIGMGRRSMKKYFESGIRPRLNKDTRHLFAKTPNEAWRFDFRKLYSVIKMMCKESAPQHLRHAELLALCEFNRWMTELERRRMNAFLSSLFSKEFWELPR